MLELAAAKELVKEVMPNVVFPELSLQNLYYGENHTLHPTKKALVGTVDGIPHLYAEPSGRYQLIQHEQVIGNVIEFCQSSEIKDQYGNAVFTPKMWNDGGKLKFDITFPENKMMVEAPRGTVEVSPKISFTNSYDLSMKISLLFEALQLACLNGMIANKAIEQAKKRHMVGFDMPKMLNLIPGTLENYPKQIAVWSKLAKINMEQKRFEEWVPALPFGQKHFDCLMHLPIIGSLSHTGDTLYKQFVNGKVNMWEAHNAVTQFITHEITSEDVRLVKSEAAEDVFMDLLK